ncbi:Neurocan core protein, partial [Ophiophagus hannah]
MTENLPRQSVYQGGNERATLAQGLSRAWEVFYAFPSTTCMVFVVLCGPPPLVENASPIGKKKERYSVHSTVRYQCAEGFLQRHLPTIKCHVNGLWENPKVLCTKREFLPSLSDTRVETGGSEAKKSVPFSSLFPLALFGWAGLQVVWGRKPGKGLMQGWDSTSSDREPVHCNKHMGPPPCPCSFLCFIPFCESTADSRGRAVCHASAVLVTGTAEGERAITEPVVIPVESHPWAHDCETSFAPWGEKIIGRAPEYVDTGRKVLEK